MSGENDVLHLTPAEGVALLQLNRPELRNAMNLNVRTLLARYVEQLGADPLTKVIIIAGDAKTYAAGADLREFASASAVDMMLSKTYLLWRVIAECPKPIIAAVAGRALGGGCELAMHADIILAGESATFGFPEVKLGIMPGAGGTQRLLRAVGKFKAMKLLLTGASITAREASAMGLVSDVVADDKLMESAVALASDIAKLPPLAVAQIKEIVLAGADASLATSLILERKACHLLFGTQDRTEGVNAFLEKRTPKFNGN